MTEPTPQRETETTWDRLRRRKVVQWGLAYAAGAWGLLQGVQFLAQAFGWPSLTLRLATIALSLGLPVVVTLAWYHGDRGQQRVTGAELTVITMLFLLGGGLLWRYERASETPGVASHAISSAPGAVVADHHSIAVLPFVNMSSDKEQDYFSDGLSEELLNLLAQVPQLRVIARTSSFSFKGKEVDIATIARTLGVANVLEGSVRKSGDKLRITAQLVRASDSSHLWSQTYDRQMADVFQVQDEIAAAVVAQLKIKLLGAAPRARVTDPRAYALYLQGREMALLNSAASLDESVELFQQALALDPAYAAAWEGLAGVYVMRSDSGLMTADESERLARDAIDHALSVDPDFAPAHARLGLIAIFYDRDLAAAARHLEHALQLDPASPDIIGAAAALSRRLGRMEQAIALGEYQMARDPLHVFGRDALANAYRYAGRLDEAIAEMRKMLRVSPDAIGAHEKIGEILLQKGDANSALVEMQLETDENARRLGLAMTYHALGRRSESDAALEPLIANQEKTLAYGIACVLAYRGEADRAFEWLEKATQNRDPGLGSLGVHPLFASLHSDRRWLPLLNRLGIAPGQLAAIKFDVTVPR